MTKPEKTRQERQADRTRRLEKAIAAVKWKVEIMPMVFHLVGFRSLQSPPLEESEIRETFSRFVELANELQDAADAFMCFCDCKYEDE